MEGCEEGFEGGDGDVLGGDGEVLFSGGMGGWGMEEFYRLGGGVIGETVFVAGEEG